MIKRYMGWNIGKADYLLINATRIEVQMSRYMIGSSILWVLIQDAHAESPCWCEYTVNAFISPEIDCFQWFPFEGGCAEEPEGPEDWNSRLRNQCDTPVTIDCTEYSMDCIQDSEACSFILSFPDRVEDMAGNSIQIEQGEQAVWAFNIPNPRNHSVYSEYSCTIVANDSQYSLDLLGSFWCDFDRSGGSDYPEDTENEESTAYYENSNKNTDSTNNKAPQAGCSVYPQSEPLWDFAWLFGGIGVLWWGFYTRQRKLNATLPKDRLSQI